VAELRKGYWVQLLPCERPDGKLGIALIARRTYAIRTDSVAVVPLDDADQPPFVEQDRCDEGKPDKAPVTLECEFVPEKPKVDVIVIGKAYAPGGKAAPEFEVGINLANRTERLRILGPRRAQWQPPKKVNDQLVPQSPTFTAPEPIKDLPLSYLLAYGGQTWWIQDERDLELAAKINAVIDQDNADKKAKQEAVKQAKAKKAAQEAKERQIQEVFAHKEASAKAKDEKLKLGDGSEGFDDEGVRIFGASASKDGTAVLSLEEFEKQQLADMARQMSEDAAAAERTVADEARRAVRRDAAGEVIEVDDGVEILTDDALAAALAAGKADQEADAARRAKDARRRAREQVERDGGTRVLEIEPDEEAPDDVWDKDLKAKLTEQDDAGKAARDKAAAARRKAEEEALARYPKIACPTNPYGRGFCVSNRREVLQRLELPQIEHPNVPLSPKDLVRDILRMDEVPPAAGFGCFPRHARPRVDHFGPPVSVLPQLEKDRDAWKRAADLEDEDQVRLVRELDKQGPPQPLRAPFFNCANLQLQWHDLRGDEAVTLTNLTKEGTLYFKLPGKALTGELDRGRGIERADLRLDTVVIETEARTVTLLWRTIYPLATWGELATYAHFIGWVLDLDVQQKRDAEWAERLRKAQGEGTAVLDLNAMPLETEPYLPPTPPEAKRGEDGVLELPKEGSYIVADDDDRWIKDAAAGVRDLDGEERKRRAEADYQKKKQAAIDALAAAEREDAERRKDVADAIQAGKPIPAKGMGPDGKPKPTKKK